MAQTLTTVQDFIDRMREELEDTVLQNYTDTELLGYLNEAVQLLWLELSQRAPWYFDSTSYMVVQNYVIAVGVTNYALPGNFLRARVLDLNGSESDNLKLKLLMDAAADGHWLIQGDIQLSTSPTVAGTMDLYYIPTATVLDNVPDNVPLREDFSQALKNYAILKAKSRNMENLGGTQGFYSVIRNAVALFVSARNRPADRGAKVRWYNWW